MLLYDICLSDICQAIGLDWAWRHWFWAVRLAHDKGSKVLIITWHSIQEEATSPVLSKSFMTRRIPELQRRWRSLWGGHCSWRVGLTGEDGGSRLVALLHVCGLRPRSRLKPSSEDANSRQCNSMDRPPCFCRHVVSLLEATFLAYITEWKAGGDPLPAFFLKKKKRKEKKANNSWKFNPTYCCISLNRARVISLHQVSLPKLHLVFCI